MKHLENMQQADDYIQKQAAEHLRLANGNNFHQRRYMVQQNIYEEEIKIDMEEILQAMPYGLNINM